jgi:hypothetical protein
MWAVSGFILYVLAGMGALLALAWLENVLTWPAEVPIGAGTIGLSVRNGIHPIVWGLLAGAGSVVAGRRLVSGLAFRPTGWLVLAIGLALAGITTFLDNEFVRASHGIYDPEYSGFTVFAGSALVAIALAAWAALAVPRGNGVILVALTVTAAVGLAALLLPFVGDAGDGIDAENLPIAVVLVGDAGYAAIASVLVIFRTLRPSPA